MSFKIHPSENYVHDISSNAIQAVRRLSQERSEAAFKSSTFLRSSSNKGCVKQIYLDHLHCLPEEPNRFVYFQTSEALEDIALNTLDNAGFKVYFPHGEKRGAHDKEDYAWHIDNVGNVKCHSDGMLRTSEDMDKGILNKILIGMGKTIKEVDVNRIQGFTETKNPGQFSYDTQMTEGIREGYERQLVVNYLGQIDYGYNPQFCVFFMINREEQVDQRDTVDREAEDHQFYNTFQALLLTKTALDLLVLKHKDSLIRWYTKLSQYNDVPATPDKIDGADSGPKHWLCRSYCPYAFRCFDTEKILKAREGAAIGRRMSKVRENKQLKPGEKEAKKKAEAAAKRRAKAREKKATR